MYVQMFKIDIGSMHVFCFVPRLSPRTRDTLM